MTQANFGIALRTARENRGISLPEASRTLRIRVDILRAIEEGDFSRMPPQGYTKNMINSYARLVGLDPGEITSLYLSESSGLASNSGRVQAQYPQSSDDSSSYSQRMGETLSPRDMANQRQFSSQGASGQFSPGRTMYDSRRSVDGDYIENGSGVNPLYAAGNQRVNRSTPDPRYSNYYADPQEESSIVSKLPFIVVGIVVIALLVFVLTIAFGGSDSDQSDDTSNVPMTGLTDSTDGDDTDADDSSSADSNTDTDTDSDSDASVDTDDSSDSQDNYSADAPTSVTVEYTIDEGMEIYVAISLNGSSTDNMITGPVTQTVEVTDTWSFATWWIEYVTIKVDGVEVDYDSVDSSGMPVWNVSFDDYLDTWYSENA